VLRRKFPVFSRLYGNSGAAIEWPGLLRRSLLLALASGPVAGLGAPPAAAQQKMSRAEAFYQDRPRNGLSCAACALFRPPAACAVVAGAISPNGWCRFFNLPD
jgi:hypothetical protein